jgi:hypothetical protein
MKVDIKVTGTREIEAAMKALGTAGREPHCEERAQPGGNAGRQRGACAGADRRRSGRPVCDGPPPEIHRQAPEAAAER